MLNILLVAPYGGVPGGITRWTSHLLEYYKNSCSRDCQLNLVPMGRSMFVNINMSIWKRLWTAWIDYRKIFTDFKQKIKRRYDIMHLTSSGGLSLYKDLYMIVRAKKYDTKTIIHFHFGRIPELKKQNNWEWKLVKKVINKVNKAIVIDQASYDTLNSYGFTNIELLPNPVSPVVDKIVAENAEIIRTNGEILFTGHIVKTKGVFELLDACNSMPGVHLKMIGHITPEMHQEIIGRYGMPRWLTICGEIPYEDVIKEMMKCDIFVLPTYTEGFPNVILEAMAAGCAIVSTPVGAIPQILEDDDQGKYGILIEPKNVEALRNALFSLLDNDSLKQEMRLNVQRRVRQRYNICSVWNKMVSIWGNC